MHWLLLTVWSDLNTWYWLIVTCLPNGGSVPSNERKLLCTLDTFAQLLLTFSIYHYVHWTPLHNCFFTFFIFACFNLSSQAKFINIIVQEKQMLKMEIPDKGESSDGVKHSRMESRPVSLDISRNKSEFFNMSDAKVNKKQ